MSDPSKTEDTCSDEEDDPEGQKEGKIFRSRLESSGDLFSPPWQSLMAYAGIGLGILIFLPFVFQLTLLLIVKHIQPAQILHKEFDLSYISQIRVVRSMFAPWGIYAGMVFAFVFFSLCLCWKQWQLAADGWILGLVERFFCCRLRHAEGATNGGRRARAQGCKYLRLCLFVVSATAMPYMAWHSSLLWWETSASRYRECSSACKNAESEDRQLCHKLGMSMVNSLNETPPEPDVVAKCFDLFKAVHNTTYIAVMIQDSRSFLMFEAVQRQIYDISILDVYGSLLGSFIILVVVSAKIALRQKSRALAKLKLQYIRDHMVVSEHELKTYKRLFMGMCHWNGQDVKQSWVLKLFREIEKKLDLETWEENNDHRKLLRDARREIKNAEGTPQLKASQDTTDQTASLKVQAEPRKEVKPWGAENIPRRKREKACGEAFNQNVDEDLNDVIDDAEPFCSDVGEHTRVAVLTVLFAVVDTTIPCCARWWRSDGSQPFFADAELRGVVMFNALVTLVSDLSIFAFLLNTYSRHKAQLEKVISFDCLWRFPEEDPLHSVTRDTTALLGLDLHQSYQGGDFTEGINDVRLKQLKRWFHLRQYVQLDKIDERVSMEVATTIAVLMLAPRFTIFTINLLVMDANFWTEQAVNLQLAWAMACTLTVTIQSLTVTLNLNDLFDRHLQRLSRLVEETKLLKSLDKSPLDDDPFVAAVTTILDVLRKSDVPSTVFGITVNRKLIAGYVALTAASCVPQGVVILRNFLAEVTNSM